MVSPSREAFESADLVVVGSGFFGATIAERAASAGFLVLVLDKRNHFGGNAHSFLDPVTGVEVHAYGSHLFHTSNTKVWDYIRQFSDFNTYRHTVWTTHRGRAYSMPINLATICSYFGRVFTPDEARALVASQSNYGSFPPSNLEEKAIASVGRELYEAFIKGYTWKQWQTDPSELAPEVIARLPVRYNFDNRYFSDTWEGLPVEGYFRVFERMLANDAISLALNVDFFDVREEVPSRTPVVYTGALDRYFNFKFGQLKWRTLDFHNQVLDVDDFQGAAVMNYADIDIPYTRVHEFFHLHPERSKTPGKTWVSYEFSRFAEGSDEPYYPVNSAQDREALGLYRGAAKKEAGVFFGGRLGSYQYLDMHMAIASALTAWENEISPYLRFVRAD